MLPQAGSPGGGDPSNKEELGPLLMDCLTHNMRQLQLNRHATAMLAGALAGICGLENLSGFVVYLLMTLLGPLVFLLEAKGKLRAYFLQGSDPFIRSPLTGFLVSCLACVSH
ncbi:hypothetical protein Esti_003686 [Eimeria stiedai]